VDAVASADGETYWVSRCELAALHQTVKGGFQHHVISRDFFLLHPLGWQLLEKLRKNKDVDTRCEYSVCSVRNQRTAMSHTNLNAGLLGGSGGDLGMVEWLRSLHRESHHRGGDGGRWSVVIRDLRAHNSKMHPVRD